MPGPTAVAAGVHRPEPERWKTPNGVAIASVPAAAAYPWTPSDGRSPAASSVNAAPVMLRCSPGPAARGELGGHPPGDRVACSPVTDEPRSPGGAGPTSVNVAPRSSL